MRSQLSTTAITILLFAAVLAPRLCSGSVIARYDVIFWDACGKGYAPILAAMGSKLLCLGVLLISAVRLIRDRRQWMWLSTLVIVSIAAFVTVSAPSQRDLFETISRGVLLIDQIESYRSHNSRYPTSLEALGSVPETGLAPQRRFFYAATASSRDDRGPWFPGTRKYLGRSPYVVCVPLVPGGTLVYRPDHSYGDLPGRIAAEGWFITSRD